MSSARLTPRYSGVIDSGPLAPVVAISTTGPRLVAGGGHILAAPADTSPSEPRGRTGRVLSILGRRSRTDAGVVEFSPPETRAPLPIRSAAPSRVVPVARRPWRVLIVSAVPGAKPKSFEVSRWQARMALGALGLLVVLSGGLVVAVGVAIRAPSLLGRAAMRSTVACLFAPSRVIQATIGL